MPVWEGVLCQHRVSNIQGVLCGQISHWSAPEIALIRKLFHSPSADIVSRCNRVMPISLERATVAAGTVLSDTDETQNAAKTGALYYSRLRISVTLLSWPFSNRKNIAEGVDIQKHFISGHYVIREIYCVACEKQIGWRYVSSLNRTSSNIGPKQSRSKFCDIVLRLVVSNHFINTFLFRWRHCKKTTNLRLAITSLKFPRSRSRSEPPSVDQKCYFKVL